MFKKKKKDNNEEGPQTKLDGETELFFLYSLYILFILHQVYYKKDMSKMP